MKPVLRTERLILRPFCDSDLEAMAAIGSDTKVMAFFNSTRTRDQTAAMIKRARNNWARDGYSFGAIEIDGVCVGMCGLSPVDFDAPFTPAVEIGWRLAFDHWGKGIAFEAASAWLDYGFNTLGLEKIIAFTPSENKRSYQLMERLNMTRQSDFTLAELPADHHLQPMRLYSLMHQSGKSALPSANARL